MGKLRDYIRDQMLDEQHVVAENVVNFKAPLLAAQAAEKGPGAAALALVNQAAERIKSIDDYATERLAHAEALVERAITNLKISHAKVQSADQLQAECTGKIQDAEQRAEQASSRLAALETELSAAKRRVKAAEIRAFEAEKALKHIEDALRAQILQAPAATPVAEVAS